MHGHGAMGELCPYRGIPSPLSDFFSFHGRNLLHHRPVLLNSANPIGQRRSSLAPATWISLPHPVSLWFLTWLIGWRDLVHPPLWELGKDSELEALGYQGAHIPQKALA